jgi:hypothetical protein
VYLLIPFKGVYSELIGFFFLQHYSTFSAICLIFRTDDSAESILFAVLFFNLLVLPTSAKRLA